MGPGQVIHYSSKKFLTGIPTLDDIVAENDDLKLTAILENALSNCQEIPFMAIDSEGSIKKIEGKYYYVLRLYGSLINDQKAVVTLLGIQVFFDVCIPDGKSPVECKARIYTSGTGKRKTAMQAIQDNNYETASDDMYSFHRKVARENGIQLSDRTLILTWDIETQSRELGKFAKVLDLNHNVFMIGMTLHWKDDPKPLKQICLVDVETEPIHRGLQSFAKIKAYHLNILEWMWERITEKFETKKEILKWKYRGKIEVKSKNTFKKKVRKKNSVNTDNKNTFYIFENGKEDTEVKEFLGNPTMIKISAEDNFFFSFLKLPGCVPIDIRVYLKKRYPHSEVEKEGSLKFFLQKWQMEKGKYPGAYVFLPKKGIETKRPVMGLDFASLYPSLIMAYNLSPEKFIFNPEEAVIIKKNENSLHEISFPFNKRTIQAWCIRHDN
ncbi:DNA polymerase family B-domain-containing protein [Rhizophagus diaphanus]|nr:DNA polymerase family B-domain-containing protein [Rhizophagus diaphanus] [Rhizophagus sp. MUCL 43196]